MRLLFITTYLNIYIIYGSEKQKNYYYQNDIAYNRKFYNIRKFNNRILTLLQIYIIRKIKVLVHNIIF